MNLRPNITRYQVCMEDGGGKGGKLACGLRTTKYCKFWRFVTNRMRHIDLGTT